MFVMKKNEGVRDDSLSVMRSPGLSAVFTSRTRIAVLDSGNMISLKNLQNETKRKIALPFNFATFLFPAQIGHVLVRATDAIYLFELESRKVFFLSFRSQLMSAFGIDFSIPVSEQVEHAG